MKRAKKCMGCGDPATQRTEADNLPVCDLCAQIPDFVTELVIDDIRAATAKVNRVVAELRLATCIRDARIYAQKLGMEMHYELKESA